VKIDLLRDSHHTKKAVAKLATSQ